MRPTSLRMIKLLPVIALLAIRAAYAADVPEYGYKVVHVYPHDPEAFTEGLFYLDGYLFEATGLAGKSSVRKVDLKRARLFSRRKFRDPISVKASLRLRTL